VRVLSQSVKNLSVRDNHQPLAVASGFLRCVTAGPTSTIPTVAAARAKDNLETCS